MNGFFWTTKKKHTTKPKEVVARIVDLLSECEQIPKEDFALARSSMSSSASNSDRESAVAAIHTSQSQECLSNECSGYSNLSEPSSESEDGFSTKKDSLSSDKTLYSKEGQTELLETSTSSKDLSELDSNRLAPSSSSSVSSDAMTDNSKTLALALANPKKKNRETWNMSEENRSDDELSSLKKYRQEHQSSEASSLSDSSGSGNSSPKIDSEKLIRLNEGLKNIEVYFVMIRSTFLTELTVTPYNESQPQDYVLSDTKNKTEELEKRDRYVELIIKYRLMQKALVPEILRKLSFETRKCIAHIFKMLIQMNLGHFIEATVDDHYEILRCLTVGYNYGETALISGSMLRDCLNEKNFVILYLTQMTSEFEHLFHVTLHNSNFDIAADAFTNITHVLHGHPRLVKNYLMTHYDRVFALFNQLLKCDNYVTKRQALQFLSKLLLDPTNFEIMQKYVSSRSNLRLVMVLLRERSSALRMDAFHVFKIFVANPHKSEEVTQTLLRNKDKLINFVTEFGKLEVNKDFQKERQLLIFTLQRLSKVHEGASSKKCVSKSAESPSSQVVDTNLSDRQVLQSTMVPGTESL